MAPPPRPLLPLLGADPSTPTDVHLVGRYAIGVAWQDRHSSIYPFELLRGACPCGACGSVAAADEPPAGVPATWPVDIKREAGGLRIRWQDNHETRLDGPALRQLCRCASCTIAHEAPR